MSYTDAGRAELSWRNASSGHALCLVRGHAELKVKCWQGGGFPTSVRSLYVYLFPLSDVAEVTGKPGVPATLELGGRVCSSDGNP